MNGQERDESELIARALEGDSQAYTSIVSLYRDAVLSYVLGIVQNNEDAEDICQESFQKCFRYLESYDSRYAFSTWLYTIAQNTSLDFLRKRRLPSSPLSEISSDGSHERISTPVLTPEDNMINDQAIENLIKAIQNLPAIYRKIAELRFIHDYPLEEIAIELNLPLGTVKTRVSRSKKILNNIWKS
ncbi:MAG: sigma-70 family RNA polymerase sigma factor [Bacteroidales bacterium]|jgi:RNA polymerase sigma factor (sigma-70 family)|nr:sigma-70 family RNA polymerase sigma factor [Bacteroidales bacterium]